MKEAVGLLPVALYLIVGAISLVMAVKNLFAKRFLPFQGQAAGIQWDDIGKPTQRVILSLLRLIGMGFLVVSLLLIMCPVITFFSPNMYHKLIPPILALFSCSGLLIVNYNLYRATKAATPWKGSLYACLALITGIVISILN